MDRAKFDQAAGEVLNFCEEIENSSLELIRTLPAEIKHGFTGKAEAEAAEAALYITIRRCQKERKRVEQEEDLSGEYRDEVIRTLGSLSRTEILASVILPPGVYPSFVAREPTSRHPVGDPSKYIITLRIEGVEREILVRPNFSIGRAFADPEDLLLVVTSVGDARRYIAPREIGQSIAHRKTYQILREEGRSIEDSIAAVQEIMRAKEPSKSGFGFQN